MNALRYGGPTRCGIGLVAIGFTILTSASWGESSGVTAIRADRLYLGNGKVVVDGVLVIRDGRITEVGTDVIIPEGATIIDVPHTTVTPGLIDANAALEASDLLAPDRRMHPRNWHEFFTPDHHHTATPDCCGSTCPRSMQHVSGTRCMACGFPEANNENVFAVGTKPRVSLAEQSSEVIPHTRVLDTINLRSPDLDRLLRGGVTTVFVSSDSAAVIGARGAIVRTGGPVDRRVLREADAVKATMGTDPSWRGRRNRPPFRRFVSFQNRRPTTRMGVTWVFRKAFHDTLRHRDGVDAYGADPVSEAAIAVLDNVLRGRIPLRIQARTQHDITTALRLTKEFGLSFTLEEATEAYRCIDLLVAAEVPVVFGPIYIRARGDRRFSSEVGQSRLHTFKMLVESGLTTALTAHELREEDGLARQAMYAMRFGLTREQVLAAVTSVPAKIIGLGDSIGTLAWGKRADVVIWQGEPFETTSRPLVVLIEGEIVLDRRAG